jgi:hypothetical protein
MKVVYGGDSVDISTVRNWAQPVRDANPGHASLYDKQRRKRPRTATDEAHRNRVEEKIWRMYISRKPANKTAAFVIHSCISKHKLAMSSLMLSDP